jgi:hypothetical protein
MNRSPLVSVAAIIAFGAAGANGGHFGVAAGSGTATGILRRHSGMAREVKAYVGGMIGKGMMEKTCRFQSFP